MAKKTSASDISPEYVLLGFLNRQAAHGYDLHEQINRELGQIWHISLSQTYNILNRLEAQGYITGSLQEQEKAPARRCFMLTSAGRRRFETWLYAPTESSTRAIRLEFLTRLYFACSTCFEMVNMMIEAQIAESRTGLERLQAILVDLPSDQTFNRLGLELRVHQLNSILNWLTETRTHLKMQGETGTDGGGNVEAGQSTGRSGS